MGLRRLLRHLRRPHSLINSDGVVQTYNVEFAPVWPLLSVATDYKPLLRMSEARHSEITRCVMASCSASDSERAPSFCMIRAHLHLAVATSAIPQEEFVPLPCWEQPAPEDFLRLFGDTSACPPTLGSVSASIEVCDPGNLRAHLQHQSQAKTIGIQFQLVHVELAELSTRLISGEHQAALLWIENQIPTAVPAWTNFFRADHPMVALAQPIDGVTEEQLHARSTVDPDERAIAYRALVRRIDDEQTVWIPIVSRNTVLMVDDRLDGVLFDANGLMWYYDLTSKQ
jgi:hypothetical protein